MLKLGKIIQFTVFIITAISFSAQVEAAASEHPYVRHQEARWGGYQQPAHMSYQAIWIKPEPEELRRELNRAIMECNVSKVTELLKEKDLDVNAKSPYTSSTHLKEAVKRMCSDIVDLLLAKGAEPNATPESGAALHQAMDVLWAPEKSDEAPNIVASLLKAGANVNAVDFAKNTALHVIAENKSNIENKYAMPIVFRLLKAGADTSLKNNFRKTPADLALSYGAKIDNYDIYTLLKMYPGKNLQERDIFSIAKNFYSDDPEMRALAETQLTELEKEGFADKNPELNRMLYLIIGKDIKEENNVQK